ncbi:MAG: hypothetical protein ABR584_10890 [Candidatus Baltobacteraceae bacterium]
MNLDPRDPKNFIVYSMMTDGSNDRPIGGCGPQAALLFFALVVIVATICLALRW